MVDEAIKRLKYLCNVIPPLLKPIEDDIFSAKPLPNKWSKKEILGHLIDSATNNHQRFIRGQFEDSPIITYAQDQWNIYNHYQMMDKTAIIAFWTAYNKQLIEIIRLIPEENLQKTCTTNDGSTITIEYLINDYIAHLEHHLKQIVKY